MVSELSLAEQYVLQVNICFLRSILKGYSKMDEISNTTEL